MTTEIVYSLFFAIIAQLAEQLICNQQVVGSIPIDGSIIYDYKLYDLYNMLITNRIRN